jgi:nitrogen fixation/metabolism regulation signal transduction histidine kinase
MSEQARYKRSAKNYLIDRDFQLKYTGYLVGVAIALSAVLGLVLWRTSANVVSQSRQVVVEGKASVVQGQETVKRGEQVLSESGRLTKVVKMGLECQYKDSPDLRKVFDEETSKDEQKLLEEQKRLEADALSLKARSQQLEEQSAGVERQQKTLLIGIVGALSLLVVAIGLAGIVVTHKVAGPIYKMKRLLRQVGEGSLTVKERLRKGDELVHFFETFESMVGDLRKAQEREISRVDEILERLERAPESRPGSRAKEFDEDGIELLKKLRAEMQEALDR